MFRLEVRCCCQPQKLRGWIEVPEKYVLGRHIRFPLLPVPDPFGPIETVELALAHYGPVRPMYGEFYLALKSEEIPIETLRRIPGFEENRHA